MRLPDSFTDSHDILNTDVEVVQAWEPGNFCHV